MASAVASVKLQRVSATKAKLVANLVRGLPIADAVATLKYTNKKAAPILLKLLNAAIANGVNNHGLNADQLYIAKIDVMMGPTLKRFQPHGRGSAKPILKRTSSFSIEVAERVSAEENNGTKG